MTNTIYNRINTIQELTPYIQNMHQKGSQYVGQCPVCGDEDHLYIKEADNKVLLYCQKCRAPFENIIKSLGLDKPTAKLPLPKVQNKSKTPKAPRTVIEDYDHIYRNPDGSVAYYKNRKKYTDGKKDFTFRHINDNGETVYKKPDNCNYLYNLDLLESASPDETLYIVEGEKCCDFMTKSGFLCTTANVGANSVKLSDVDKAMLDKFTTKVIIPDNDDAGQRYLGLFPDCNVLNLEDIWVDIQPKQDIADYIESGHNLDLIRNYKFAPANEVPLHNYSDTNSGDIGISCLSTWEEISSTALLMDICMNCSDIDKADKLSALRDKAKTIQKFNDLNAKIKAVEKQCFQIKREQHRQSGNAGIQLSDSPILLDVGDYTVNYKGLFLYDKCIIPQPLLITKLFEDIENDTVRLELAFYDKKRWKHITVDKSVTANKNRIVELANFGLLVTSEIAIGVVQYLQVLQMLNDIPTQSTVTHLGFADKRFVPYAKDIIYTGTDFADIYKSVHSKGSLDEWIKLYRDVRNDNIAVRTAVASSFASPLIHILGGLPFFTHIRGDSDTGKTVTLRLAASVWGYHDKYMVNFNSTTFAAETTAYFLHNLPLVIDELQTAKEHEITGLIYKTTQGKGKQRGTASGGVATSRSWNCCMITNGEMPLTKSNSHSGEYNRIIDIPVSSQIFKNPSNVYAVCNENYGHAGRFFIEHLNEYKSREILNRWETLLNRNNSEISGKHRMTLALILTADELVNRMLFGMNETKSEVDTIEFYQRLSKIIISTSESDSTTRAYDFICSWVAENGDKFQENPYGEQWGYISGGGTNVSISGRILKEVLDKHKYNYVQTLEGLAKRGLIKCGNDGKNTKPFRLNQVLTRGIELPLPKEI